MTHENRILARHPLRADLLMLEVRRYAVTRRAGSARAIAAVRAAVRAGVRP